MRLNNNDEIKFNEIVFIIVMVIRDNNLSTNCREISKTLQFVFLFYHKKMFLISLCLNDPQQSFIYHKKTTIEKSN